MIEFKYLNHLQVHKAQDNPSDFIHVKITGSDHIEKLNNSKFKINNTTIDFSGANCCILGSSNRIILE